MGNARRLGSGGGNCRRGGGGGKYFPTCKHKRPKRQSLQVLSYSPPLLHASTSSSSSFCLIPCFALHFIRISMRCCSISLFSCAQDLVCTVVERREDYLPLAIMRCLQTSVISSSSRIQSHSLMIIQSSTVLSPKNMYLRLSSRSLLCVCMVEDD